MTGSLELVAFCDEVIGWLRRYFRKLEISDESLALDLIHETGPDGLFLEASHTLRHVRSDWRPGLFDRLAFRRWSAEVRATLARQANEKVRAILGSHRAEPLSKEALEPIEGVVNIEARRRQSDVSE